MAEGPKKTAKKLSEKPIADASLAQRAGQADRLDTQGRDYSKLGSDTTSRPPVVDAASIVRAAFACKAEGTRPSDFSIIKRGATGPYCDQYLPPDVVTQDIQVKDGIETREIRIYERPGFPLSFRDGETWYDVGPANVSGVSNHTGFEQTFAKPALLTMVDGKVKVRPLKSVTDSSRGHSRPGSRVYVLTGRDNLGLAVGSPTLIPAINYLLNPQELKRDLAKESTNLRDDKLSRKDAAEFYESMRELLSKGYEIVVQEDVTRKTFVDALASPQAAALFHDGHAGIKNDQVYLLFNEPEKWCDGIEVRGLSPTGVPAEFKPSKSLKFIWTNACQAGRAEDFYRDTLHLSRNTRWLAGDVDQTSKTIAERIHAKKNGLAAVVASLAKLE